MGNIQSKKMDFPSKSLLLIELTRSSTTGTEKDNDKSFRDVDVIR